MKKNKTGSVNYAYSVEEILLGRFKSVAELKAEIRRTIRDRKKRSWQFNGLASRNSRIIICFKKVVDSVSEYHEPLAYECRAC